MKKPIGKPLFDENTMKKIMLEASAPGANVPDIARKYGTVANNIYRWLRAYKRSITNLTRSGNGGGSLVEQPVQASFTSDEAETEVQRLRRELARVYKLLAQTYE